LGVLFFSTPIKLHINFLVFLALTKKHCGLKNIFILKNTPGFFFFRAARVGVVVLFRGVVF
ncbi:hypothetical protein ACQWHL_25205, partial [Salmonella enterica subsp. enterica serovar Infantis]